MPYNTYTIPQLKANYGIETETVFETLFPSVIAYPASDNLRQTLDYNIPLAMAISTEKARSEMIITPILIELKKLSNNHISFFSGVEFNVDAENGLNGRCDYLLSLDKEQSMVRAPIIAMVEAKNDNITKGIGKCAAEMVAAKIFNEQNGNPIETIYGVITTGSNWKFLKLENGTIYIEAKEYFVENLNLILGIFLEMLGIDTVDNLEESTIKYWTNYSKYQQV